MKYSPELVKEIITKVESGASNKEAALLCDISEETFYQWQRPKLKTGEINPEYHPEFPELLKKANIKRRVAMVNRILIAANKSWQAAAWYLERKSDGSVVLKCTDGNDNRYILQKFDWTDCPVDLTLYCIDGVLLLSSEY